VGFAVSTASHLMLPVVSSATVAISGATNISRIRSTLTGGDAEIFFNIEALDTIAADVTAAQADMVVTTVGSFDVGDHVFIYDNTYTNKEYVTIKSIVTATSTITMTTNFVNNYTAVVGSTKLAIVPHANAFMSLKAGYNLNESGLDIENVYMRKLQAANTTLTGYAVVS